MAAAAEAAAGRAILQLVVALAVAAGTPARIFASQALGGPCDDPDRDVKLTILRRLAQRTGQTSAHLAGGLLQVSNSANYDTPSSLAENVLLLDDKFLLGRAGCDRLGRANSVLQYCPLCLQTDSRPYFRRAWRLAHMAVCLAHSCRLHDRCWQCDKQVAPLSQRTTGRSPRCSRCLAVLCDAPPCPSSARTRQAALQQMLIFVATRVPAQDRVIHVTALKRYFGHDIRGWVAERERAVGRLSPASAKEWFGEPARRRPTLRTTRLIPAGNVPFPNIPTQHEPRSGTSFRDNHLANGLRKDAWWPNERSDLAAVSNHRWIAVCHSASRALSVTALHPWHICHDIGASRFYPKICAPPFFTGPAEYCYLRV
jgi:hypothetical protein